MTGVVIFIHRENIFCITECNVHIWAGFYAGLDSNMYLYLQLYLNIDIFLFVFGIELKIKKGHIFVFDLYMKSICKYNQMHIKIPNKR